MSEHTEQVALFEWAAWLELQRPELGLLFAIPNGGHRHKAVAARMKAEGVKAGVPDIFLPVPRGDYAGLFVELKVGKNKPTPAQVEWHALLIEQGYKVVVCWGWQAASVEIEKYLC